LFFNKPFLEDGLGPLGLSIKRKKTRRGFLRAWAWVWAKRKKIKNEKKNEKKIDPVK